MGTKADSDVRAARFFAAIDWLALERQTSAPAFPPPPECVSERDTRAALEAYVARRPSAQSGGSGGSGEAKGGDGEEGDGDGSKPWHLGLERVASHPPYVQ